MWNLFCTPKSSMENPSLRVNKHGGSTSRTFILTAEADSLPTDARQLLEDYGLVVCHSTRSNDLSVHARIDSTGYVHLLWESIAEANEFSHAVILITELREQTADTLFSDLGTVASVIKAATSASPTARCVHSGHQGEATGDQIKSSETTMLCMPSPSRASNEGTPSCSTIFRKSTEEGTTLQHTSTTRGRSTKMCTIPELPSCWETCNERSTWTAHLRAHLSTYSASLNRLSWLLLRGYSLMAKTTWTLNYEKCLEQHSWVWAEYGEWTNRRQLLSQGYWSFAQRNSSEELSRERWRSCDCTTRQWSPSIWTILGASEQRSLKIYPGIFFFCDSSWVAFQKLLWKVNCEFGTRMKLRNKRLRKTKSQIKHTRIRLGNHISIGNEVLYMDFLGEGIHGDENNACLWRTTSFRHFCNLTWCCGICHPFSCLYDR